MTPEQQANFQKLVDRRQQFVHYAQHHTGDRNLAEDIVQDAYILAMENIHQFSGHEPWKWMNMIIMNRFRSLLRRSKFHGGSIDDVAEPSIPASGFGTIYLNQILDCMTKCKNGDLVLQMAVGIEYSEIAEIRGIPEGTVKSRSFRARKRLAAMLPEEA